MAILLLATAMPLFFFVSCIREKKDVVEIVFDPQTSYTLKETNVESLISDSGVTRYKIITATWLMFGKASEPYWYFPDGAYLEKFDTTFNIEASIKADTAYFYERRKLWELNGHVDISNLKGERFQTSQLFWDQNKETIYSDSFIRISKGESINTGIGFRSNQDMSIYEIYNSSADIPVDMQRRAIVGDSIPPDSLNNKENMPATIPENNRD
ncbi:MAG: LPS export ABC transporter periplasmic protein LptC [Tannerella sp.]|jgi:LPS export ABC transporter protein LptC|nr:LPS export ABC transporter periplasmic protein LptC [Tannerella sp.]